MNVDQGYEDWQRRREQGDAPPGFSDRVMAAVEAYEAGKRRAPLGSMLLLAMLSSRFSKIGICSLAAATCALRLWHVVAIFVAQ